MIYRDVYILELDDGFYIYDDEASMICFESLEETKEYIDRILG